MVDRREPLVVTRSMAMVVLLTDKDDEAEEAAEAAEAAEGAAAAGTAGNAADETGSMSITRYSTT